MDLRLFILFGITLFGYNFQFSHGQTCSTIRNCTLCSGTTCLQCADGYAQSFDGTGCCSKGCYPDDQGFHLCDSNTGACTYEGCLSGYWGTNCVYCPDLIQNCDVCSVRQNTQILECVVCGTGFNKTTSWTSCCPPGCDSCVGDDGTSCTSCKSSFYLYNNKCDKCGNNCIPPADGSARCDPVTGACYLGCLTGWHGAKCNVSCNLNNCATCTYNEAAGNLTCADCNAGFYGPYCSVCNVNCNPASNGSLDICMQDGTCSYGCQPGWRGNLCDMRCDAAANLGNCEQCDRYAFTCTKCKDGYWGSQCQYTCNSNCVKMQGQNTCNITNGNCDHGCMSGYYKSDCSGTCPHCGHDVCDRNTGNCLDLICDSGYYGANCNTTCPGNCKPNPTTLQPYCDFSYGNCTYGCVDGKHGSYCQLGCSVYCAASSTATETGPLCRQADGACLYQCKAGYYQPQCNTACVSQCVDNTCDITKGTCLECEKTNPGYLCPTGTCTQGKYGQMCQVNCPVNCQLTCGRYNGICVACKAGYYGGTCDKVCGQCSSGTCDKDSGVCTSDCLPGYWGSYCNQTCSHTGCRTCLQANGVCETCKTGFYGTDCSRNCSQFCSKNANSLISCDMVSGNCDEGSCQAGYWNTPCDRTCSATCLVDGNGHRICAYSNGNCSLGCVNTYYGVQCTLNCSARCLSRLCDRNGACAVGCITGAYGNQCELACRQTCNDGTCDRITGECEECKKPVDQQTALCRTAACPAPYFGLHCNVSCSSNCKDGICDRYTSVCRACVNDFWDNQCMTPCGSCVGNTCNQTNGACLYGCDDGYYTAACTQPCKYSGCQTCDGVSGECTSCKAAKWSTNCDVNCSSNCLPDNVNGIIYCDRFTAACHMNACRPGYYQRDCNRPCNAHCGLNSAGFRPCDIDTGVCSVAQCDHMWYGPQCNLVCPVTCQNQTCNRTGVCVDRCVAGYWGPMCETRCEPENTCNNGECDQQQGVCLECLKASPSPLCRTAACQPMTMWGLTCQNSCPTNCVNGTCSRDVGTCSSCKAGFYGDLCNKTCPNCLNDRCFQSDGACVSGCKNGWYTLQCMTSCKHTGCLNCDRTSGDCIACKTGLWGTNCSQACSRTCAEVSGVITCNRFSGNCDAGACKAGYYTSNCNSSCSQYCSNVACDIDAGTCSPCINGWYGQRCEGQCSTKCKNSNCEVNEDQCREGCTAGYWGSRCEYNCNANCANKACHMDTAECLYGCTANLYYGLTCSEPCGGHCLDSVCNRTGYCLKGCAIGWYGDKCQYQCSDVSKCNDGSCSRLQGQCDDCSAATPGPNCPTADCPSGKRGNLCEMNCTSTNCLYNQCGRYTDSCNGCPVTYYGNLCNQRCLHCRPGTGCDQGTGECVEGCADGWYTPTCNTQCSSLCTSCERQTGDCITCAAGRWGSACSSNCSKNCKNSETGANLIYCDKQTGACSEGACKVGYWASDCTQGCSQNCKTDANNNRMCAYLDGACQNGCVDTYYGTKCDAICSARCKDKLCINFANTCVISCAEGFYGATCSGVCSSFCAGEGKCNTTSGNCLSGCIDGYYGTRCDNGCKNTCVDNKCDSNGGCPDCSLDPVGPNCRVQVCTAGYYGPTCESRCPGQYCLNNQCHRNNGTCDNGCLSGYYGAYCTEVCQCDTAGTDTCEQAKGTCICKTGRHGTLCDQSCSSGCVGLVCARDGTCTNGCVSGRYGATCNQNCTNCLDQQCYASTGYCIGKCIDGFYGLQCKQTCADECKTCDQTTGTCLTCKNSYFSPSTACNRVCSSNCVQQGTARTCDQTTGNCLYGCKTGYYGLNCSNTCGFCDSCDPNTGVCASCQDGWWGTMCKTACNVNCAIGSTNTRNCRQLDGYCSNGCAAGFYGNSCNTACLGPNCLDGVCDRLTGKCPSCKAFYYGENCLSQCGNCTNGQCLQANGYCTGTCPAGKYGNRCENTCLSLCRDSTCDKTSGNCADCQISPKGANCFEQDPVTAAPQTATENLSVGSIAGITAGCVAFVILFVVVFVCCMNYKRQYDDTKTEIRLPSDVLERLSTHRSLHSSVSANYPVARVVGDDEKDFVLF